MAVPATQTATRNRILVVDDDESIRLLLERALGQEYEIVTAADGAEALDAAAGDPAIDLVLLDIDMPGRNGLEVCETLCAHRNTAGVPIIMLTGNRDDEDEVKALEAGAVDFIRKPAQLSVIQSRISLHLRMKEYRDHLDLLVTERTQQLYDAQLEIVYRLGLASEYRDNETGMHVRRMSAYSHLLAREAGLATDWCETLYHAAPLHDIGKIAIPDRILLKPGRLTKEEFEVIKTHTTVGAKILEGSGSQILELARRIALSHHERWDGAGYPHGLAGDTIPLEARICTISDVLDALTSERPYKRAWSFAEAFEEVLSLSGYAFQPELVEIFRANRAALEHIYNTHREI